MAAREPHDHLYVAHSPGAALDVGLEVVSRIVVAAVALALFRGLRVEELCAAPHAVGADPGRQVAEQSPGAVQQPRLHQRRQYGHVGARLRLAVVERPYAVAHLEPDVPEERQEPPDGFVGVAVGVVFIVLLLGLANMARGGSPNLSQKLMRWRVGLQFVAVLVIMGVVGTAVGLVYPITTVSIQNGRPICLRSSTDSAWSSSEKNGLGPGGGISASGRKSTTSPRRFCAICFRLT